MWSQSEFQEALDASQRASRRQIQELEQAVQHLTAENHRLKGANSFRQEVPLQVHVGHTMPPQPQQPLTVSVGVRNPGSPRQLPAEPSARERQLMAELAEKTALLDKYRAKTRHLNLGIEAQPAPTAPVAGPGAKSVTRPRASLGGKATRDESAERDSPLPSPIALRGVGVSCDMGTQNVPLQQHSFCQTEPMSSPSHRGTDAVLQGRKVCDAMGRLPTSRAIHVNLYAVPASINPAAFALPLPMNEDQPSAATMPLTKGSSWSEEPAPMSASLPATRSNRA